MVSPLFPSKAIWALLSLYASTIDARPLPLPSPVSLICSEPGRNRLSNDAFRIIRKMAQIATSPIDPLLGRVSSWRGMRPREGGPRFHEGFDIVAPRGTPVRAILPGKVLHVTSEPWNHGSDAGFDGYGRNVVVYYPTLDLYNIYAHLESTVVREGQKVERGETLGALGKSDSEVAGYHLHWALRTHAPHGRPGWPYLKSTTSGISVDPIPYLASVGIRVDSSGRFIPQSDITPNHTGLLNASPSPTAHEKKTNTKLYLLGAGIAGGLAWLLKR